MLNNGAWWALQSPFDHLRASDVFDKSTYTSIAEAFSKLLEPTNSEGQMISKFTPGIYKDELILGVTEQVADHFPALFSENSLRFLHDLLGLPYLPRIAAEMHSCSKGVPSGYIHTDYNTAWFNESSANCRGLIYPKLSECDYFTGEPKTPSAIPKEYPRAATLIFYLCNDGWTPGDGGETALYSSSQETTNTDFSLVPPISNSMLLFRCSPHSYHRFITNPGRTRNSIVLRLHTTVEFAKSEWGPVPTSKMR